MARNKKQSETLEKFMNRLIVQLQVNGQQRTMQHYQATLHSIMRYKQGLYLHQIDADLVQSFESYLKNVAKTCRNTSSFYLRILRAVYNRAVESGYVIQQHPFKNVYTGIDKTNKRAVSVEVIRSIKHLNQEELSPKQEMARDTFLMCFYLRGISFIDLAHLRKSDIKDGYLHYTRSKTGQRLSVKWEKAMQDIVAKYQHLTTYSPYLFPFLVGNERDAFRLYHNAESRIAYHLKKIGVKIGVQGKLTLYVARHSWATVARDRNVSVSVISQALGHDAEKTTQIYLRSIQSSEIDKANAEIIDSL